MLQQALDFVLDPIYLRIVIVTLLVFIGMWLLWKTYMHLSKKNLFELHRPKDKDATFWNKAAYWLKYLLVLPLLIFFWFVIFVVCLRVLTLKTDPADIMFLGIVLISSIRIAAYFNERMAEDLAKMLPLTLLAAIILSPSFISTNIRIEDLYVFKTEFMRFAKYLLFIIVLEFVLKVVNRLIKKFSASQGQ
jgi:hypothetical protein